MTEESKINDKTGLVTTGFLLITIALYGDEFDMKLAAQGVSHLDEDLVTKYWESTIATQGIFNEAVKNNS